MPSYAVPDDLYAGPAVLAPVRTNRGHQIGRWLIGPLATALLLIILVFYVLFTSHVVEGDSMEPTLRDGDRALVTRDYDSATRGDVVVFETVGEGGVTEGLIKRVVAVPGDTISVTAGVATVNGVSEPAGAYIPEPSDRIVIAPVKVPTGRIFVMGDNRPVSLDSRRIGFIPMSSVVGRARYLWAPVGRVGAID